MSNRLFKCLLSIFTMFTIIFGSSTVVNAKTRYNHIDVRFDGTINLIQKLDNQVISNRTIDVTISDVTGSVNGNELSFTEKQGIGNEHEWREDNLNLKTTDKVIISCLLSSPKLNNNQPVTFTKTFSTLELEQAIQNCPGKSGFDFDINSQDIVDQLSAKISYKTATGGTLNDGSTSSTLTGLIQGESFPCFPEVKAFDNYEFIGWFNSDTNSKDYPKTITGNSSWVAKFQEKLGSLTFNKTDDEGNPIKDAIFTLANQNHQYSATSSNDGLVKFEGIAYGDYTLKETQVSDDYFIDTNNYDITINDDNRNLVLDNFENVRKISSITVTKNVNKKSVTYLDTLIYTIQITNIGNVDYDINLADKLNSHLKINKTNIGEYESNLYHYQGTIKPGESVEIKIDTTVIDKVTTNEIISNIAYINQQPSNKVDVTLYPLPVITINNPTNEIPVKNVFNKTSSSKVTTGDTSNILLVSCLTGISLLAIIYLIKKH